MSVMSKQIVPIVATVFVVLFLWLSAVPLLSWYEYSSYHEQVAEESFQWHHSDVDSYSFEFEFRDFQSEFVLEPVRIYVRNSKFQTAYLYDSNETIDITGITDYPQTVEAAFDIITRLLEEHPHEIDVEYDAILHYPKRISVSFSRSENDRASYTIRSFRQEYDTP